MRYVRKTDGITGHALIQVSDAGENCIILYPGANFDNDTAYMEQVLSGFSAGDILMLQNEISNLSWLLERGRKKGMRIMLNPSPMDGALAEMDLTGIAWLMLNETEGGALTGEGEPGSDPADASSPPARNAGDPHAGKGRSDAWRRQKSSAPALLSGKNRGHHGGRRYLHRIFRGGRTGKRGSGGRAPACLGGRGDWLFPKRERRFPSP